MITDLLASISVQPRRRGRPKLGSDARILACAEMAREGVSVRTMAKRLGVPRSTVGRWLRKTHA